MPKPAAATPFHAVLSAAAFDAASVSIVYTESPLENGRPLEVSVSSPKNAKAAWFPLLSNKVQRNTDFLMLRGGMPLMSVTSNDSEPHKAAT